MVLQYKPKDGKRYRDYPGKNKMTIALSSCKFRLIDKSRKKVLSEGGYVKVLRRMRQIEFFKHN